MNIELIEIPESEFLTLDFPTLFQNKKLDRVFGIITNGKSKYKLAWQSTNVKPLLKLIHGTICLIGIDLIFVIFDFDKGEVLKKISLDYFFYKLKVDNQFIYVITELEVIKISIEDTKFYKTYPLPDYFENIELIEGVLLVKCIGGEVVKIE